jgi:hypothetical protein
VRDTPVELTGAEGGKFSRFVITVQGGKVRVQRDAAAPVESALPANAPARGAFGLSAASSLGAFTNLHVRPL